MEDNFITTTSAIKYGKITKYFIFGLCFHMYMVQSVQCLECLNCVCLLCLIVSEKSLIVVLMSCLLSCVSASISLFSNVVFLFELSRYLILDIVLITSSKQA